MNRANDGAAPAPQETCLRQASVPVVGSAQFHSSVNVYIAVPVKGTATPSFVAGEKTIRPTALRADAPNAGSVALSTCASST